MGGDRDGATVPQRSDAEVSDLSWVPSGILLEPMEALVFYCSECGCLFVPQREGDTVYPDRNTFVGVDGKVCADVTDCACHSLPYEMQSIEVTPAAEERACRRLTEIIQEVRSRGDQ